MGAERQLSTVGPTDLFRAHSAGQDVDVAGQLISNLVRSSPSPTVVYADAATITFDVSKPGWQQVTLGGNRALLLTNASLYQQFEVALIQDGSGSRTITSYFSGYTVKWAGGSAPTLTTTAGKADLLTFKVVAPTVLWGFVAGQNI